MGDARADLILSWFTAWADGDLDRWLGAMTEDAEWIPEIVLGVEGPKAYRGTEALREYWTEWEGVFGQSRIDVVDFRDAGQDRVVALGTLRTHARDSGIELERPGGWVVDVRDGRIARAHSFPTWAEALGAAGLPDTTATRA